MQSKWSGRDESKFAVTFHAGNVFFGVSFREDDDEEELEEDGAPKKKTTQKLSQFFVRADSEFEQKVYYFLVFDVV